ncbi:hypothetical protein CU321_07035 [Prochlorococcus marinus str. MU1412]|nr:hypothetical protein [Prochlorococcus marinus str. MU1412]
MIFLKKDITNKYVQKFIVKIKYFFSNQKVRFLKNAVIVWSTTQILLHVSLLFFPISWSVFISNCFYVPLGYFFYGRNVFGVYKFKNSYFQKFVLLSIINWFLNTFGTSLVHSYNINKNLSAFIVMPFLAAFSYITQKYIVFKSSF